MIRSFNMLGNMTIHRISKEDFDIFNLQYSDLLHFMVGSSIKL